MKRCGQIFLQRKKTPCCESRRVMAIRIIRSYRTILCKVGCALTGSSFRDLEAGALVSMNNRRGTLVEEWMKRLVYPSNSCTVKIVRRRYWNSGWTEKYHQSSVTTAAMPRRRRSTHTGDILCLDSVARGSYGHAK
ncbi:hypothetical protein EVAR_56490_1 [Eumeta japonica]|uniref:Uncharacterized protein n=1 Tax=Eumeta variegata TaxID=151549 RepID=A0A4C1XM69_EUMVA|nr:hypothetical protein EVAR_56490_1 [Eumeta japonica]